MSNDPKKQPDGTKWFPVKRITFSPPATIPGAGAATTVLRGDITQTNVPRWTIEYAPSMRHHKITHYTVDPNREPEVVMVHESRCTWEPMT